MKIFQILNKMKIQSLLILQFPIMIYMNIYFFSLECQKEYYFVFSGISTGQEIGPFAFQFIILNEEKNVINLSPSLTDHYSFSYDQKNFSFSHNETKYVLITIRYKAYLKINENDNIIYESQTNSLSKLIEFKKIIIIQFFLIILKLKIICHIFISNFSMIQRFKNMILKKGH